MIQEMLSAFLGKRTSSSDTIRLVDPEGLLKRRGIAIGKRYNHLKKTYNRYEISRLGSSVNDRRVKYWKVVYSGENADGDKFIPIYYK